MFSLLNKGDAEDRHLFARAIAEALKIITTVDHDLTLSLEMKCYAM
jgi:hypothetical protein